jgi:tetratricopeptide (TPR) repeat protein
VPPVGLLLDRYASGDYRVVMAPYFDLAEIEAIYDGLATNGARWIDGAGDGQGESKRRLIAASFALETAARRAGPTPTSGDPRIAGGSNGALRSVLQLHELRQMLVAWGGAALTTAIPFYPRFADWKDNWKVPPLRPPEAKLPVQPGECVWFVAAVSLLQSATPSSLTDLPLGLFSGSMRDFGPWTYLLVPLAEKRCPAEPRLPMASANAEAYFTSRSPRGDPLPLRQAFSGQQPRTMDVYVGQRALKHYEALTKTPAVAAEAHLRAGYMLIRLGNSVRARAHLADADQPSSTPLVQYLSRLFTGATWQAERPAEAEAAYRSALEILPHARSASTLLAALLVARDQGAHATEVLESAGPAADDPWTSSFHQGDFRLYPEALARLRALLK